MSYGDRHASSFEGKDSVLSHYSNYVEYSKYALLKLPAVLQDMMRNDVTNIMYCMEFLKRLGVLAEDGTKIEVKDKSNRFLNRVLGLPLYYQSLVLKAFCGICDAKIKLDKANGSYTDGVKGTCQFEH